MKKSITCLPSVNQRDLHFFGESILTRVKQIEIIILFGSYARNDYVVYDEKYEFGKLQFYVSDYDILVVTIGISDGVALKTLNDIEELYYDQADDLDKQLPVQFISEDMKELNKYLEESRYFYTQIKQDSVVLCDSGKFKLARHRKLSFDEIKRQAQEYFNSKFVYANGFLHTAKLTYKEKYHQMASLLLHQASESYIYVIRLVFTLENPKQHNLSKLLSSVKKYSNEFIKVFPQDTPEEKILFNLIKVAFMWKVDTTLISRYPKRILMPYPVPKVELLRDITK